MGSTSSRRPRRRILRAVLALAVLWAAVGGPAPEGARADHGFPHPAVGTLQATGPAGWTEGMTFDMTVSYGGGDSTITPDWTAAGIGFRWRSGPLELPPGELETLSPPPFSWTWVQPCHTVRDVGGADLSCTYRVTMHNGVPKEGYTDLELVPSTGLCKEHPESPGQCSAVWDVIDGLFQPVIVRAQVALDGNPPARPVADFTYSQTARRTISVNASASTGAGLTYSWTWGDGSLATPFSSTPTATRDYATTGVKQLKLTVKDSGGRTASVTKAVEVVGLRVNSTDDQPNLEPTTSEVCDTGDSVGSVPECTLRAALQAANAFVGPDDISFAVPGTPTITPATPLPEISDPVTIDGTTQPGGIVTLSGASLPAGSDAIGLRVGAPDTTVRGLAVGGFAATGIRVSAAGARAKIVGNRIGTDSAGATAAPNGTGLLIEGAPNVKVGEAGAGNLLSGNSAMGVLVKGAGAAGTVVAGNDVGTDPTGDVAVPNLVGVGIDGARNVTVGGAGGAANHIAGNRNFGVVVSSASGAVSGIVITRNVIGLTRAGSGIVPGQSGGVLVESAPAGATATGTKVEDNTLAGAKEADVILIGSKTVATEVVGNRIGVRPTGEVLTLPDASRGLSGVRIDGAPNSIVDGNTITGHSLMEVVVHGTAEVGTSGSPPTQTVTFNHWPTRTFDLGEATGLGTIIRDNHIGTAGSGGRKGVFGVLVAYGADDTTIGPGNDIGNQTAGVVASRVDDLRVIGNRVGIDAGGSVAKNDTGLLLLGTDRAVIGRPGEGNVISGNGFGLLVEGAGPGDQAGNAWADETLIQANLVGTSPGGASAVPNGNGIGIGVGARKTTVGGDTLAEGNVLSGNTFDGLGVSESIGTFPLHSPPDETSIRNNRIGIGVGGGALPNGEAGITDIDGARTSIVETVVAHNPVGIHLGPETGTTISRSRLYGGSLGNLVLGDGASGAIGTPTVDGAVSDPSRPGGSTLVVTVPAGGPATVEVFRSPGGCPSGPDELRTYVGTFPSTPSGQSQSQLPTALAAGDGITITATRAAGTSAISDCVPIQLPANIAVITTPDGQQLVLSSPEGTRLVGARSLPVPPGAPDGVTFPLGFLDFTVEGVAPGGRVVVDVLLPEGAVVDSYHRFGPHSDPFAQEWYAWPYDPASGIGAEVLGRTVRLHFVDGGPGDDDRAANGTVVDPGGPGVTDPTTPDPTPQPPSPDEPAAGAGGSLPRTGADLLRLVAGAVVLLAAGVGALRGRRLAR